MSKNVGKIIGIDLGTTTSCVSVFEGSEKIVIPNSEGKRTTPSIVSFKDNERKVGDPAKRQAVTNPVNTIYSVKRLMGKKYADVKHLKMPYKIKEGANGMAVVEIDGKDFTPQEISAMILQKMKKTAEDYLGQTVTEAVITVPAYFNDVERTATIEAGKIAGLDVKRIINEPTAAALAYGLDKGHEQRIVVYDIGGGTSDVSILDMGDGVFEVQSTAGDSLIGGDNFDEEIVEFLTKMFKDEHGVNLLDDSMAAQRLKDAAEKAKIELSSTTSTEINLPYIMPVNGVPKHLVYTLTRAKFESLIDGYLVKLKILCEQALADSGLSKSDISEVVLVGGSTRVPSVANIAKEVFGKEPSKSVNPDEAVSLGACVQGGVLSGNITDILLLDVLPISLGIETMGGVMTKMIDSNTTIPVTKTQTYTTASDNQSSVEIHILQGERAMAKDNKTLGRFHLDGIPMAARGVPQIEVTFDINANGVLNVSAQDKGTGKKQSIRIEGSSNLSDVDIEKMRNDAKMNEDADKKAKEVIDVRNAADTMVFSTRKQMSEMSDKLSSDEKLELETLMSTLESSKQGDDIEKIKKDTEAISNRWNLISVRMYQASQGTTNEANNNTANEANNTDNVSDTEFEEVK